MPRGKMGHCRTDTHDIHQRIDGPDFVEVHCFDTAAMHPSLGLRQGREHGKNSGLEMGVERRIDNPLADVSPLTVGRIRLKPPNTQPLPSQAATSSFREVKAN